MPKKQEVNYTIPPLSEHKGYAEAFQKLGQLNAKLNELADEENQLVTEHCTARKDSSGHYGSQVDDLLAGDVAVLPDVSSIEKRLNDCRAQIVLYKRAIQKQTMEVDHQRGEASYEVCNQLRPQHNENVKEICKALVALSEICKTEKTFRRQVEIAGYISAHLRPMSWPALDPGRREYTHSRINNFLGQCEEFGFIETRQFREGIVPTDQDPILVAARLADEKRRAKEHEERKKAKEKSIAKKLAKKVKGVIIS